jgi:hypothetical protein
LGEIRLDVDGDLWVCVAGGDPGTWTRLLREDSAEGRTVPITPIRALDTRAPGGRANGAPSIPGQTHGPLHGGQTVTLDPAGTGPIPATATGIIGNAIVLAPTTNGYLRIIPAGTGATTSAVSFTKATTTSNAYTTALSPTGLTATAPITPTATYHLVLDITAYIT